MGTRADVERVLRLLLPTLPESEWPYVFASGVLASSDVVGAEGDAYTTTPRRARLLHPLSWRRNGFLLTPDALFLRRGLLHRGLAIFPLARTQSIGMWQGPVARLFRTAGLHVHTVAGRVSGRLSGIDRDAALRAFADVEDAALAAASTDHSHRWAGPESPAAPSGPPAGAPA